MRDCAQFSVVTPCYNSGAFLNETIKSIISQNCGSLEYFVMDGASSDESVEVIRKHERFITGWVSEPDNGQSDAINKGFSRSSGEWLCWVNADDILLPGALARISRCIADNPLAEIVTGNVVYIDEKDRVTRCVRVPKQNWSFYRFGVGFFAAPAIFFRRDLFERVGGVDVSLHYSMDVDLFHKFCRANAKVVHINQYLGGFRFHAASKTGMFRGREKKAFENPETTRVRATYIPCVSKTTIRLFRFLQRLIRLVNLDIPLGWVDRMHWRNKTWQQVFK